MLFVSRFAPGFAQALITGSLAIFFALLLVRLGCAAAEQPSRRKALITLIVAVLLWAAASAMLNGGQPDLTQFPGRGEWLFLAAYAGMAAFLVLDASKRLASSGASGLETVIICCGAACLAGGSFVTPLAHRLDSDGLGLLLAVLYPLLDVVLLLVVIAQMSLRTRGGARESGTLIAGFALLAGADSTFLIHISGSTYDYSTVSIVLWGLAFALIVGHACRTPNLAAAPPSERGITTTIVAGGLAATVFLAFEPAGTVRTYLLVPAVLTLAAAGSRLAMALGAANRAAEAIALSRSDDLTSLPNRRAMLHQLGQHIADRAPLGLMILDLDGFKDVNDTLGHAAGDTVLREIARRMREVLPTPVLLARLGGDEFAIVVVSDDEIELMETAHLVLAAVRAPLQIDGISLSADASVGITVRTDDDVHSSELLRRADVAMYHAKEQRVGALLYDPDTDDFSRDRLRLGEELRRAIDEHQLVLWYQPQLDAATADLCGLEALVRWQHPSRGMVNPALFLPAARRNGLMQALSEEVARLAVADIQRWAQRGLRPRVALNCAPPELMSGAFVARLHEMVRAADIDPRRITIEVTEDSFLAEPGRARAILTGVRELGFQVAIDDYGTGFSSLSYLRDLPIQELKLDQSFVSALSTDPRSKMIVASTIQMSKALELRFVAEGVEDARTAAELVAMGADVLQGYHFSRPIPAEQVESWTKTRVATGLFA
ncbi:putative bifunctional diguanylate cyclase/phosphodiesterase [uncultured Jatrophihabitans sp.]|uniref:putative bifunctional diguanylate cyclase/phosphodiesterase n=1 Tax=uncultured Jatrophihabitans sp. TaxID=1610747 RepID=UPI0035CBE15F